MTPCSICARVACSSDTMFKIAISARTPPPCAATTLSAISEFAVTLAAGRREIPLVALAGTQHAGVLRLDLLQRQTFPFAISDFDQSRVNFVIVRLKTERGPHDLHRFARAFERACNIFEILWSPVIARKQVVQQDPAFGGLLATMRIENGVAAALQPALSIEIGLAVSNVIEDRHTRFAFLADPVAANEPKLGSAIPCQRQCLARPDASCRRYDNRHRHDEFPRSPHATYLTGDRRPPRQPLQW